MCVPDRTTKGEPVVLNPREIPRTMTRPEFRLRYRMARHMSRGRAVRGTQMNMSWMSAFSDWCDVEEEGERLGFWRNPERRAWGLGFGTTLSQELESQWIGILNRDDWWESLLNEEDAQDAAVPE